MMEIECKHFGIIKQVQNMNNTHRTKETGARIWGTVSIHTSWIVKPLILLLYQDSLSLYRERKTTVATQVEQSSTVDGDLGFRVSSSSSEFEGSWRYTSSVSTIGLGFIAALCFQEIVAFHIRYFWFVWRLSRRLRFPGSCMCRAPYVREFPW